MLELLLKTVCGPANIKKKMPLSLSFLFMWNSGVVELLLSVLQDVFLVTLLQKFSKYGSQTGSSRSWKLV